MQGRNINKIIFTTLLLILKKRSVIRNWKSIIFPHFDHCADLERAVVSMKAWEGEELAPPSESIQQQESQAPNACRSGGKDTDCEFHERQPIRYRVQSTVAETDLPSVKKKPKFDLVQDKSLAWPSLRYVGSYVAKF